MPKSKHFFGPTICYACGYFDTDGVTGIKPECTIAVRNTSDSSCEWFKKGIPSSYPVHQPDCERGFRDACEILGL